MPPWRRCSARQCQRACSSEFLKVLVFHLFNFMANTCQAGDLPQWERWQVLCGRCVHLGRVALPAVYGSRPRDDWKHWGTWKLQDHCPADYNQCFFHRFWTPPPIWRTCSRGSVRFPLLPSGLRRDPRTLSKCTLSYSEVHSSNSCDKHVWR